MISAGAAEYRGSLEAASHATVLSGAEVTASVDAALII
jgi:hypothetical protein